MAVEILADLKRWGRIAMEFGTRITSERKKKVTIGVVCLAIVATAAVLCLSFVFVGE